MEPLLDYRTILKDVPLKEVPSFFKNLPVIGRGRVDVQRGGLVADKFT